MEIIMDNEWLVNHIHHRLRRFFLASCIHNKAHRVVNLRMAVAEMTPSAIRSVKLSPNCFGKKVAQWMCQSHHTSTALVAVDAAVEGCRFYWWGEFYAAVDHFPFSYRQPVFGDVLLLNFDSKEVNECKGVAHKFT